VKRLAEGVAEYKELVQLKRELKSTETTLKNTNANLEQAEADQTPPPSRVFIS
jgi:hypothetical protein